MNLILLQYNYTIENLFRKRLRKLLPNFLTTLLVSLYCSNIIEEHINYIHFDAKYRSELEIADYYNVFGKSDKKLNEEIDKRDSLEEKESIFKDGDIYKMHTYKDSILKTEGAYVLYPGNKTEQFFESDMIVPSVGAFSLTPGNNGVDENNLENFIREVLKTLLFKHGLINLNWKSLDK